MTTTTEPALAPTDEEPETTPGLTPAPTARETAAPTPDEPGTPTEALTSDESVSGSAPVEGPALSWEQAPDGGLSTDRGPESEAPASGTDGTPASGTDGTPASDGTRTPARAPASDETEATAPARTPASVEAPAPPTPKAGSVVLPPGPARRSPVPSVRAVRLVAEGTAAGEVPARRRGVSVTPVRLPLARPTAAPAAPPTTRTEEPQP
ncbi:hypothetical protein ACF06X_24505 [Streptomyces sp. NPDC015346]|uniref:hypothetical protein n=1 Tax=Streptomyces sp. NPDC015346 TaxID=3364954 RepID=UPI0036FD8DD6